jgi:hypothetical protein
VLRFRRVDDDLCAHRLFSKSAAIPALSFLLKFPAYADLSKRFSEAFVVHRNRKHKRHSGHLPGGVTYIAYTRAGI